MTLTPDIAAEAADPAVRNLALSALADDDLVNLILQRSEVMFDRPRSGQVIRAWEAGDDAPMRAEVARLGAEIAYRAAGVIHAEYRALAPVLAARKPRRVADIGCGYAFFDLFLAREHGARLLLIDLESNERRHFGFKAEGAAYASLSVARRILEDNGIAPDMIETLNPRDRAPETAGPVDLAVSFLSCGFHYPVDLYLPFLRDALEPGGAAIFDLRESTAADQAAKLAAFGTLTDLPAPPKARRVMVTKA
ncbi:MAG: class I SAM-dependent methyltransferase [Paracoccaceae bacterium]|nr:MAG: class I SAM-dependent methyltransferase [Paracoccaceae bacterium]